MEWKEEKKHKVIEQGVTRDKTMAIGFQQWQSKHLDQKSHTIGLDWIGLIRAESTFFFFMGGGISYGQDVICYVKKNFDTGERGKGKELNGEL